MKERVFLTRADFERARTVDGLCRDGDAIRARLGGTVIRLEVSARGDRATVHGPGYRLEVAWPGLEIESAAFDDPRAVVDSALLWRLRTAWQGIFASPFPNPVNPGGAA